MEQIYLIEIFIDKVTIFFDDQEDSGAKKGLITKVNFGPNVQLIIKEGQLAKSGKEQDDIITCDAEGKRKFTRTIRVGKSYLFPSFPDTVICTLSKFPLQIEVWNDDDTEENNIFVGCGRMPWDSIFFQKLKESTDPRKIYEALSVKQRTILWHECCCKPAAEVEFILRLTPLGGSIITEFQQPLNDPNSIVFRSNKSPSMFICQRKDGADPNFCMLGSIYESTTLEDPEIIKNATKKIEVCTELQSCGMGAKGNDYRCIHDKNEKKEEMKQYAIDKIKMGEISGPCGNVNCPLAHKVRGFIRNLDIYKRKTKNLKETKAPSNKICGACHCKDDREHRETCPSRKPCEHPTCGLDGCGKVARSVHDNICRAIEKIDPSVASSKSEKSSDRSSESDKSAKSDKSTQSDNRGKPAGGGTKTVAYVFSVNKVTNFKESRFGRDYTFRSLNATYNAYLTAGASKVKSDVECCYSSVKVNTDTEQNVELKYSKSGICTVQTNGSCCISMPSMETAQGTHFHSVSTPNLRSLQDQPSTHSMCANNQFIYNVREVRQSNKHCLEFADDKDYECRELNFCLNSSISCIDIGGERCCRPIPNTNAAQETLVFDSASIPDLGSAEPSLRSIRTHDPFIYNVSEDKQYNKYCLEITDDKDCICSPKKPPPPCKTFDCDGLQDTVSIASVKTHGPLCPQFKCPPVNPTFDVEEMVEEDEEFNLGPCSVMGSPCSIPDGFARMYKNAALPRPPPSQGKTGKICCTKEYERLKTAIKEYMKVEKDHDLRCVNTEKRCWDEDQVLLAFMGKTCCGKHKLALQNKFNERPKKK